ncbi:hypothetical protein F5Y19DRAFT_401907 [Xylariaceae sp. FL1651]|nr:hypothetical protein F5Y19DRAFT_401907 [Xylariaceae sp. FL1651]
MITPDWVTWAYAGDGLDAEKPFEPAQAAFKEALGIFKENLTKDPAKKSLADELLVTFTLEDVLNAVLEAKKRSESSSRGSRLRECLSIFSQRLLYYSNIMDVLVQHHPEYVSLAWGAMKFIFGAIVENERTGTTIVTALCDVTDSLPSVELSLALYPTTLMKRLVSMLYAHIVRFLIRAWKYYEESNFMRAVHTITRPAALRYDDLLRLIRRDEEMVRRHATTSSQAEIRALHNSVLAVSSQIEKEANKAQSECMDIQTSLASFGDWMTQIRITLSEAQLRQALSMISSQCIIDHKSTFNLAAQLCEASIFRQRSGYNNAAFWTSSELQAWNKADTSSIILLKSAFHQRTQIRSFCTEVVKQLLKDHTAVFWIFMSRDQEYPLLETLKSLVFQALSLNYSFYTANGMSFQLSKYLEACFEEDYLNILGDLLQHLKRVYIIANSEAMSSSIALQCRECLRRLSRMLQERNCQTVLKIITTWYGPGTSDGNTLEDFVLSLNATNGQRSRRKARKQTRRRQVLLAPMRELRT